MIYRRGGLEAALFLSARPTAGRYDRRRLSSVGGGFSRGIHSDPSGRAAEGGFDTGMRMPYSATGTSTSLSDHRSLSRASLVSKRVRPVAPKGVSKRHFTRVAGGGALARGWSWGCGGDFCAAKKCLLAPDCRIAKIVTARGVGEISAINLTRKRALLSASCKPPFAFCPTPITQYLLY